MCPRGRLLLLPRIHIHRDEFKLAKCVWKLYRQLALPLQYRFVGTVGTHRITGVYQQATRRTVYVYGQVRVSIRTHRHVLLHSTSSTIWETQTHL